jgi:hypothetical protein
MMNRRINSQRVILNKLKLGITQIKKEWNKIETQAQITDEYAYLSTKSFKKMSEVVNSKKNYKNDCIDFE